ncbi:LuxR C-terminal-related transcriptional regulator [Tessaracoccus terricola]
MLVQVVQGLSNADRTVTGISHETVKSYVSRILMKLQLRDRVQAVVPRTPARPRGRHVSRTGAH